MVFFTSKNIVVGHAELQSTQEQLRALLTLLQIWKGFIVSGAYFSFDVRRQYPIIVYFFLQTFAPTKIDYFQVDRAAAMWFSPLAAVLGDKETVRTVSKVHFKLWRNGKKWNNVLIQVAKGYYSYLTFSPALAAYRVSKWIITIFIILLYKLFVVPALS